MSALLALAAALCYGVSDFTAALGSRRLGVLRVTALGYAAALPVILAMWPAAPGVFSGGAVLAGAAAAVLATAGFLGFYAALALGPMGVLSPLMGVLGSLVPVVIALVAGERPTPLAVAAVIAAIAAAGLVSAGGGRATRPSA
ncbi:MAG: hypothetical protein QM635_06850, partial [Microbacteriaceae bacterium]